DDVGRDRWTSSLPCRILGRKGNRQDSAVVEADVYCYQPKETRDEKTRADQQHRGQRDLRYNQCTTREARPATSGRRPSTLLQSSEEAGTRGVPGWNDPDDDASRDRRKHGKPQHVGIEAD